MTTTIVNLHKEVYDVYIGREALGPFKDGTFGNPIRVSPGTNRDKVLKRYRQYFLRRIYVDHVFRRKVLALKGKRLGCFCKPKDCHGDIIVEWLNRKETK